MEARYNAPINSKLASILGLVAVIFVVIVIALYVSVVNIGGDEVGLVEKKFGGGKLPAGRILAVSGENGFQAQTLEPGWHFFYWPWQYDIEKVSVVQVPQGSLGVVQTSDGISLPEGTIYATEWDKPDKMIDAAYFLTEGKGFKGPQLTVLKPGKYRLNTKLFTVKTEKLTNVAIGTVAVIKSNVGQAMNTENRLVPQGNRGIWDAPFNEGQYYLHPEAYEVTPISVRQQKVSYTAEDESGESKIKFMRPITVRSKDGFTFPVDVRITYVVKAQDAPKVVASVGDDDMVLSKLVTPNVRAIFRNNAEKVKALEYVQNRSVQEEQSAVMLSEDMAKYGVTILAVLIGDVGDEESLGNLLKTQTDREIAVQEQETFQEQQRAAEQEKALKRTVQEAEEEMRLATAAYEVKIAEEKRQQIKISAEAEAERVTITAEAQAEAFKLVAGVIGESNAALIEIMKIVAENNIQITPQVFSASGGENQMSNALMGTILKDMMDKKIEKPKP